jgi:hypothetical protein
MSTFNMQRHRAEMMRMFWPVDLRSGIPLTKEQAETLFSRETQPVLRDENNLSPRRAALLEAVRRGYWRTK